MKLILLVGIFALALSLAACDQGKEVPNLEVIEAPSVAETVAKEVTVCDLKNDPAKYNRVQVKVTGYYSRGFEESELFDPGCKSRQWIWVDMGGKRSIDVMYCCGFTPSPTREEELEVEGVQLPIVEDASFNKYDELLAKGTNVKATVIGTYFSGEEQHYPNGETAWAGYGHMGIGTLFVVQQVLSVEPTNTKRR